MAYQDKPPWNTGNEIPATARKTTIVFGDTCAVKVTNMLGPEPVAFQVSLKKMPASRKKMLREIADGTRKLCDSRIIAKTDPRTDKETWYYYLITRNESPVLDTNAFITLMPQWVTDTETNSDRPFKTLLPSGRKWYVGDGRYLLAQTRRLVGLRKMIGYRYRNGGGAGHGRKKLVGRQRMRSQQLRNVRDEVRRRMVTDVIRQCEREEAGTIVYREPASDAVKQHCWFYRNDLEFDWTAFLGDLKNVAKRKGIEVKVKKIKIAEVLTIEEDARKEPPVLRVRRRSDTDEGTPERDGEVA